VISRAALFRDRLASPARRRWELKSASSRALERRIPVGRSAYFSAEFYSTGVDAQQQ